MRIAYVIIFLAALSVARGDTNTVTVTGSQEGHQTEFVSERRDQIATLSLELLRTATYEAPPSIATEKRFKEAEQTSHLHLTFTPPRTVTIRFSTPGRADKSVEITEMVIPISASKMPDYIFVRERDKIRAFAKYDPRPAMALQDALKEK